MPGVTPTMMPSGRPSPGFDVTSEIASVLTSLDEASDGSSSEDGNELILTSSEDGNEAAGSSMDDGSSTSTMIGMGSSTNSDSASTTTQTTAIQKETTIRYQLVPMDDTFIEVYRPSKALGEKENLKVDALDGSPTKVTQLKFGLGGVFEEAAAVAGEASLKLRSASLHLYALSDAGFGGYISQLPSSLEWNEETAVWNDYVNEGQTNSKELLPGSVNESLGEFGSVVNDMWYEADLTEKVGKMFDSSRGGENGGNDDDSFLALRITTDSSDGAIYASKENPLGNGPILELQFVIVSATSSSETGSVASTVEPTIMKSEIEMGEGSNLMEAAAELSEDGVNGTTENTAEATALTSTTATVTVSVADILDTLPPIEQHINSKAERGSKPSKMKKKSSKSNRKKGKGSRMLRSRIDHT